MKRFFIPAAAILMAAACRSPQEAKSITAGSILTAHGEDGAPATLRVESVERDPKDADGDVWLYQLSFRDQDGAWKGFCLPDREGRTYAIPLQGTWDALHNHVPGDEITFACTNGILAKCVRWGYKPWKTVAGVSLADYHQACVHMVPADYCGNGNAHTRNGTAIDVWDRLGIQKREAQADLVFEAGWSPHGAVYVNKPRYGEKLESLVSECPDRLQGRTALDAPNLDEKAIVARWPEVLLFNESKVLTEMP